MGTVALKTSQRRPTPAMTSPRRPLDVPKASVPTGLPVHFQIRHIGLSIYYILGSQKSPFIHVSLHRVVLQCFYSVVWASEQTMGQSESQNSAKICVRKPLSFPVMV